jgi:hypothetical protein
MEKKFDIFDTKTYKYVPEGIALIKGTVLYNEESKTFITWKELTDIIIHLEAFLKNYSRILTKEGIEHTLDNYIKKMGFDAIIETKSSKKVKEALTKFQLESNTKNLFNPRDPKTFKYANKYKLTKIDNVFIYDFSKIENEQEYLYETEYVNLINEYYEFKKEFEENNDIDFEKICKYKADLHAMVCRKIIKSDLIINNYQYSLAQYEQIKDLTEDEKIKLTDLIINHFEKKEKKYKLQQDIYDNKIPVDNYLFTSLCYVDNVDDELKIMKEYYSSFDSITSIQELKELLNNDYLKNYPKEKKQIFSRLKNNLFDICE